MIEFFDDEIPLFADFAMRISGDSMMPDLSDGETVFIQKQSHLESGEVGIFIVNGKPYCKRLERENDTVVLVSTNPVFPPKAISAGDEMEILGKVLGKL